MEIIGKLVQKLPLQSGISKTGNSWQKQEFVIETLEQYPRKICANVWGDRAAILETLNIDDKIVVSFDLESREFNGKWYTDVKASKIEPVATNSQTQHSQSGQAAPASYTAPTDGMPPEFDALPGEGMADDLPF